MTYVVAEMNTLGADFTLSHHRTSLTKLGSLKRQTTLNINMIAEVDKKCKRFFQKYKKTFLSRDQTKNKDQTTGE